MQNSTHRRILNPIDFDTIQEYSGVAGKSRKSDVAPLGRNVRDLWANFDERNRKNRFDRQIQKELTSLRSPVTKDLTMRCTCQWIMALTT